MADSVAGNPMGMGAPVIVMPETILGLAEARPASSAAMVQADDPRLEELLRKITAVTSAEGAAIALRQQEAIVCRATAGKAPPLGAVLNPREGLSGACFRSGEPVLCRDSEGDERANAMACRAIGLRAALLVPVTKDQRVEGVLEVFSAKPDVFDGNDLAAMLRAADTIAELLPEPVVAEEAVASSPKAVTEPGVRGAEPMPGVRQSPPQPANVLLRLVQGPRPWRLAVYWSSKLVRNALSLATLTVPLSYLGYFLLGPVIRPGALAGTSVLAFMTAVVEPGMRLADYFFAFRAVVREWNFMFLIVGVLTLMARGIALQPVMFSLRKIEELARPRKHVTYLPYVPHRAEFK